MPLESNPIESDAESLARSKGSDADVARLRLWAASLAEGPELWRYDDAEVVTLLASHLESARLAGTAASAPVALFPYSVVASPAGGAAPAPSGGRGGGGNQAASAPTARATPPAEPASLLDQAAMAETLRRAAQDGVPFCEECARAAAAS
jgi:hypothetical protein